MPDLKKHVKVSRVFDAPVQEVWKLWTEPELVKQWWGPDKFTCPLANINFKEGSTSLVSMKAPDAFGGQTHYSIWKYIKINPLQEIEFIQSLANEKGVKQKPVDVGMPPDFPDDVRTVVTFKAIAHDKTEMIVTQYADFGQMTHFAKLGLEQSLDKAVLVYKLK